MSDRVAGKFFSDMRISRQIARQSRLEGIPRSGAILAARVLVRIKDNSLRSVVQFFLRIGPYS